MHTMSDDPARPATPVAPAGSGRAVVEAALTEDRGEVQGRLLLSLASRITRTLDLQEVLDESLAALRELLHFGGGAIQLVVDGALVAAATDPPMAPEARTVRIPVGQGVSGTIAATGEPIYVADIATDERVHPEGRAKGVSAGVRSYFGVPLIAHGGPIGVLQVDSPDIDAFGPEVRALVLAFTPTISAAVQNARLFEQEREAAQRLREADQLKQDFLSIVSHELRTPLTSMLGFADTLAEHLEELPPDQAVAITRRIRTAGERLERLIGDLLFASRIERGFVDLQVRATRLDVAVAAALEEAADPDHPVRVDLPSDLPPVLADPDRLHQVLTNLLTNAAKFSPTGEHIEVRAAVDGRRVRLDVQDRGRGVPPEARDAIFELFYQAEGATTRSVGGLGIGLYVVKRLCEAMDIVLDVESAPQTGTRVSLNLPAEEVHGT
jgi:signal transduction histidine kinase